MPIRVAPCKNPTLVTPEEAVAEGCPVLTKVRHVSIPRGSRPTVRWQLHSPSGDTYDLSLCGEPDEEISLSLSLSLSPALAVLVRLSECDGSVVWEVDGTVYDFLNGVVDFPVPSLVADKAGIYRLSIALVDADRRPIVVEDGLLSVERSLFGSLSQEGGPPTLSEIRMALRDSPAENVLLQAAEFSADEIVFSITRPIAEWNETPPPGDRFTCASFPWREHWLKGTIGILLQTAAHHYMRNKLPAAQGGLMIADKAKDQEYFALAAAYRQEWRAWMIAKKIERNAGRFFGSFR